MKKFVKIFKDKNGDEILMVRGDLTMKDLMSVKPASRWNPEYWHPKYEKNLKRLLSCIFPIKIIGDYEKRLTYGAIVTGKKDFKGDDLLLLNQGNIQFTGLDLNDANKIKKNSPWNIKRAKVKTNSLLLARSGVGGVGKNKITIVDNPLNATVDSFVDILDLNSEQINPFYVVVFWKTCFGWLQVERIINGVGTVNISFDEIREIKIPVLPEKIQKNIKSKYKKMSKYHGKAMKARKKNNETGYKKNIETAEKMLKDLIARTEAVIRGERKDVI